MLLLCFIVLVMHLGFSHVDRDTLRCNNKDEGWLIMSIEFLNFIHLEKSAERYAGGHLSDCSSSRSRCITARCPRRESIQPLLDSANLPLVSFSDKLRLGRDSSKRSTSAIPMMSTAHNQILWVKIRAVPLRLSIRMVAPIKPDVVVAVNECKPISRKVEATIGIPASHVW